MTCLLWFHFVVKLYYRSSLANFDSSLSWARLSSVAACSCCRSFIFLSMLSESPAILHGWGRWVEQPLFDVWPSEFGQWKAERYFPHHYTVLHFVCIKLCASFWVTNSRVIGGVFMCFVWISEQTAIISLYSINWLVSITQTVSVYCAVRTGCLYIILYN